MQPSAPYVWIKIVCDSCGHSWDIKVNQEWLNCKAVIPQQEQCSKCRNKAKRLARRWHDETHQLRFRFDSPNEGGQRL